MIKEGDFAESILKTAKDLYVDVIVWGSHSRRWLDEILMGSVTEKVLHRSKIPPFIIPIRQKNKALFSYRSLLSCCYRINKHTT